MLIAYALLQWPWRRTVEDHLYSFERYGSARYFYVNLAVPGVAAAYRGMQFDSIVWHTTFLAWLRWPPLDQRRGLMKRARRFKGRARRQVALPQDEFLGSSHVNEFIEEFGVDHVFSVAPPSEWPKIYAGVDRDRVSFSRVLTGYLDPATQARIDAILAERPERTVDIGYRAGPAKPFLGRHAMLKTEIADAVRSRAQARGLRVDISTREEDTLFGDDWYRFLASCRYTIGVEGGASVLDRDGSIRARVASYLDEHPEASYEEVEAACFPGEDGELALTAISPRHLEACATRTAQILIEGEYSGVLQPERHYLPLRRYMSNLDQVLEVVEGGGHEEELAGAAHADVVAGGHWTYRRLVEDVERELPAGRARAPLSAALCALSRAVDRASRPLLPLALRLMMPLRRSLLGALRLRGYGGRDRSSGRRPWSLRRKQAKGRPVDGALVVYHRPTAPWIKDASTVVEHLSAFRRHSGHEIWEINTDAGFPRALADLDFKAIVLHYSVFGMGVYRLKEPWRAWLKESSAYKIAFFQDECTRCQRRFRFLDEHRIDCVYTCLEPSEFGKVYGRYTEVPRLVSNIPGYVGDELVAAAERFAVPDEERTVDVGYRGRPLPAYLGRGAQEKHVIGVRFAELAAGSGLRLDLAGAETDRLYGDDWYRFMANCRCVLGVESGVSAFDLEDEVLSEYERRVAEGRAVGLDDLESLPRWEDVVYYRTISPRHFEAAAFRICQILFEGRYSGILEPMKHYIPLKKDFSNVDEVIRLASDPQVRRELTENAHRDLIASGDWSYARFVEGFDEVLREAGVGEADRAATETVDAALARGARLRHTRRLGEWLVFALLRRTPFRQMILFAHPVTSRIRRFIFKPQAGDTPA